MTIVIVKKFPAVATKQISAVEGLFSIEPSIGGQELTFKPLTKGHGLRVRCDFDRSAALATLAAGNIVRIPAIAVKTTGNLQGSLVLEKVGEHTSVRMKVEGKGHNVSLTVQASPSELLGG